ncbi:MAG: hypothetical protein HC842_02420 [Cytophagales bacterium]|nr:hypothetical protein [Cytophagales bacterium]
MKNLFYFSLCLATAWACDTKAPAPDMESTASWPQIQKAETGSMPFYLSAQTLDLGFRIPGLQSFVWARQGNEVVMLGGRKNGFHGRTNPSTQFPTRLANDSIILSI